MIKIISSITIVSFLFLGILPYENAFAQEDLVLPPVGQILPLSSQFIPLIIKGLKIHKDNPFEFDFIINQGQENLPKDQFQKESLKLVKYFLASLTIPENDLWVNLSPYEKNHITTPELGVTEMGKDLLSQDYVLKQLTSSLIYPEGEIGKKFWSTVYALAEKKYHTTNVPINTFNKVWIVPAKAFVYENYDNQTAYVLESKLKVMLEEDYLALQKNSSNTVILSPRLKHSGVNSAKDLNKINSIRDSSATPQNDVNALGSQIVREIVIPELAKEVNYGKNFANLRQITNSLILAAWFKRALKASILVKLYVDQKKMKGVDLEDKTVTERIFQQYLRAYKKGVYNYIKEEADPVSGEIIPRKYFSGGYKFLPRSIQIKNAMDPVQLIGEIKDRAVTVKFNDETDLPRMAKSISLAQAEGLLKDPRALAYHIVGLGVERIRDPDKLSAYLLMGISFLTLKKMGRDIVYIDTTGHVNKGMVSSTADHIKLGPRGRIFAYSSKGVNAAMNGKLTAKQHAPLDPGGIDLNTSNIDFQIKRNGQGIPLPVRFQDLKNIHINGLSPIIIKDVPITNLPEFLGVSI